MSTTEQLILNGVGLIQESVQVSLVHKVRLLAVLQAVNSQAEHTEHWFGPIPQ